MNNKTNELAARVSTYVVESRTEASGRSGKIFEARADDFLSVREEKEVSQEVSGLRELARGPDLKPARELKEKLEEIKKDYCEKYNIREQELEAEEGWS